MHFGETHNLPQTLPNFSHCKALVNIGGKEGIGTNKKSERLRASPGHTFFQLFINIVDVLKTGKKNIPMSYLSPTVIFFTTHTKL